MLFPRKSLITVDGLLVDTTTIPWEEIISFSTTDSEGFISFNVITKDTVYWVLRDSNYSIEAFTQHVAQKSGLEIAAEAPPTMMKRWRKKGQEYIHADFFDKLADNFYGIQSKEGILYGRFVFVFFIVCLAAVLFGYFTSR